MPVLYLIDLLFFFSGTERHLFELVTSLDRRRFVPYVVAFRGSEEFKRRLAGFGIPLRILGIDRVYGLRQAKLLFELRSFICRNGIRVLQSFHTNADLYGALLGRVSGVPVVISSRRDMGFDRTGRSRLLYRLLNRYVDNVICVADRVKRRVMEEDGIGEERITVIRNGIETGKLDLQIDAAAERRKAGIPDGVPVVGMLANFNPVKGHRYFLDACERIWERYPAARVLFAGKGPEEDEVRRRVCERRRADHVHFLGYREDIARILAVMDILVAPSLSEGFSNSILEALYCGKAVVATDVGGNPEAIIDGETGILVPPARPDAIAAAVLRLLDDPSLARRCGINGRRLVRRKFLLPVMLRETTALYERLLRRKGVLPPALFDKNLSK